MFHQKPLSPDLYPVEELLQNTKQLSSHSLLENLQ